MHRRWLLTGTSAFAAMLAPARGQSPDFISDLDPFMVSAAGAVALSVAAVVWAMRVSGASRNLSLRWSGRLAEMEARLEKAESVLSAHPGLVLVWEDDADSIASGWGEPKILGGPAALASLLSFSSQNDDHRASPVDLLLEALGNLPVQDESVDETMSLKERIRDLRRHGMAFSGNVVTPDGRSIEVDGRVAGGQVALWITDPAVRMAEDGAIVGAFRERATDLHGSHALIERSPIPIWRRNADLELVWVNKAYVDLVEAENVADVLKRQVEIDNAVKKLATNAGRERATSEGKIIFNTAGERRVFRIVETPLHGAGDAALGGFAIDVTELDRTKTDLRQHIEANKRTLDQIQTAVAIFGANQNLLYCNRAFQSLWGLDDAQLGGRAYHGELLDHLRLAGRLPEPSDYDSWKSHQLALYTERHSAPGAERDGDAPDEVWHLPDGKTVRCAKQRHPLGGVMVAFEDITEKIGLEAQFNTQLKVQRATLNNLAEGVAVFGADGVLRLYNKAFQKLWRLDERRLNGKPHIDVIHKHLGDRVVDASAALDALRRCITSKSPGDREPLIVPEVALEDGRTLAFGTEPLPDGATLAHFLDVTDSKAREKELKERNAILENADRLKSKFVDHVSYQLRTPLSTIIGFSEMLDGQMFGVLNERQKDYVASILTASYHLRDLINDIIDLAAIDAGKLELELRSVNLRELLENAATFAALKAEDTQLKLRVECPRDIGEAMLDERRVKQILFNLLSNAFANSDAGGSVVLSAARADGVVKLSVADTGRGLSPEDQAKAFDAFESRGPSAGAGLGLALVERFTKLHGGWVRLVSKPGDGAKITLYLPDIAIAPTRDADDGSPAGEQDEEAQPVKPARRRTPARKRKSGGDGAAASAAE